MNDNPTPAFDDAVAQPFRLVRRDRAGMMQKALEVIRDQAATKPNGGSWAAGVATLCLATAPPENVDISNPA